MWWAVAIGVACSVGGVVVSYYAETPSGGTIVLLAVGAFLVASAVRRRRGPGRAGRPTPAPSGTTTSTARAAATPPLEHGDHVDYLHDGHRHAAHEGHYDEHGEHAEVEPR